ncbi:uncharacterized protein METZ01_LOCUS392485 [marine metagenome]|uniref:Uncharacterized protein n=1 Tax=marine metagenome TaxID=408172 RepID=A0A382V140_9ZZZZ
MNKLDEKLNKTFDRLILFPADDRVNQKCRYVTPLILFSIKAGPASLC